MDAEDTRGFRLDLVREADQERPDAGLERRDFLKLAGFTLAASWAGGCSRGPDQHAVSPAELSEDVLPGLVYRIATTSFADGSGCGVLATCRDGRPIKLEGNPAHPVNRGGLTAAVQASLLSLYDGTRFATPRLAGAASDWEVVDSAVRERLAAARASGGGVRLLTGTVTGPSTLAWIDRFLAAHPGSRHVSYDALSCSALLDAWEATRDVRVLPRFDLERAGVLACFDADPLGTWISPAGFTAARAAARRPDGPAPRMSRHWQFEARLSLSGAAADRRVLLAPQQTAPALAVLGWLLAERAGRVPDAAAPDATALPSGVREALAALADELWEHRGEALVLCGRNDRDSQLLAAWIAELLGSPGRTLDLERPSRQRAGDDRALQTLRAELLGGQVELLVVAGCNPAYDIAGFDRALAAAGMLLCTSPLPDETSALAHGICPEPHELERWDDAEPLAGIFGIGQPTVPPLRPGRTLRASLARWLGDDREDRELLGEHWRNAILPLDAEAVAFEPWFDRVLARGFVELPVARREPRSFDFAPVAAALQRTAATAPDAREDLVLVLHPTVSMLDGRGAHNPWLQELPDPLTKTVWDNHAALSPATARRLSLRTGDVVRIADAEGAARELSVLVQPGQHDGIVAVAIGYGRLGTDRFTRIGPQWLQGRATVRPGGTVGVDVTPWRQLRDGRLAEDIVAVRVERTGRRSELACTQEHHSLEVPGLLPGQRGAVRDAVRQIAFVPGRPAALPAGGGAHGPYLWSSSPPEGAPRWGMAIDLAACTGCSACVIGCQAENNIPVVGRDEVRRHREMAWLRIDRYHAERPDGGVDVVHQPMLCQHCEHAPCETVCPVLATVHSSDGLNTQVYSRCVGTRYCANNCPYKVRRFNWFDYAREDKLQNLSLNPSVTIRSRGVMEKCSFCVQRIQAARATARREGRALQDGDVVPACQQSCPAGAIVFGNLADPDSAVSRLAALPRAYRVLDELGVRPVVTYLADVRRS